MLYTKLKSPNGKEFWTLPPPPQSSTYPVSDCGPPDIRPITRSDIWRFHMVEWGQTLRKNGYTVLDVIDTETLKIFEPPPDNG